MGIRKLPSGDLVVQLKEQGNKQPLVARPKWIEAVAPSARTILDLYPVFVHEVEVSRVKTTNQKQAIKSLENQNSKLHTGLRIQRVAWPRGIGNSGKRHSSLTAFFDTPEAANRVVEHGFVEGGM